jgi:putative DNA primase/helicase
MSRSRYPRAWSRKPPPDGIEYVTPIPDAAPTREHWTKTRAGLLPTANWTYFNADGQPLFYRSRFDIPGRRKSYRTLTLWRTPEGGLVWRTNDPPGLRPLLGLDRLAKYPNAKVIVCEGEKCAVAAATVYNAPEYVTVTSMNGAHLAHLSDWSPLKDRDVIVLPDMGEEGAEYATSVVALAYDAEAKSLSLVNIKSFASQVLERVGVVGTPETWDIADAITADPLKRNWPPPINDPRLLRHAFEECLKLAPRTFISWGTYRMDPRKGGWLTYIPPVEDDEKPPAKTKKKENDEKPPPPKPTRICPAFEILGRCRNAEGDGWGLYLRWRDYDRVYHEMFVSGSLMQGEMPKLCGPLADNGLATNPGQQRALATYLICCRTDARLRIVHRTGWHEIDNLHVFALSSTMMLGGDIGERVVLDASAKGPYSTAGTLEQWQNGVGKLAAPHSIAVLAISTALSGPLLDIVGAEGGGFHFVGSSSIGKSTAVFAAASVWGLGSTAPKGSVGGFARPWLTTGNGVEGIAASRSDTVLILDEIHLAEARHVSNIIYALTGGIGKSRMRADTTMRTSKTWRVPIISSGEVTSATKIAEERGKTAKAGQQVRLIDIAADRGKGFGAFDNGGEGGDAKALAEAIGREARTHYGTAGPAFVERILASGRGRLPQRINDFIAKFVKGCVAAGADPQVRRVANRFALSAAAGELAIELGVLPWAKGTAEKAARDILATWIGDRGGLEGGEALQAVSRVRLFIEQYGLSRFDSVTNLNERGVLNRAGWRRGIDATCEWLILPEVWKEICGTLNPTSVAKTLTAKGMLKRGKDCFASVVNIGGHTLRLYVVSNTIFEGANEPEEPGGAKKADKAKELGPDVPF